MLVGLDDWGWALGGPVIMVYGAMYHHNGGVGRPAMSEDYRAF